MTKCDCGLSVHARANNYDPTRTTSLRNAFAREFSKRFSALRGAIRKAIVERDVFGLTRNRSITAFQDLSIPQRRAFAFPRSSDKVAAFMRWLGQQEEAGLLELANIEQVGTGVEAAWTNKFIGDSYARGVQRARYELRNAKLDIPTIEESGGIQTVLSAPPHLDRVGLLYTRVFSELKGITSTMDTQISRILSQGMIDGDNPIVLARKINRTISGPVGGLGITDTLGRFIPAERRAKMLARTEVIRAHSEATLQEYRNWEVAGVKAKAEFVTAGDNRVCAECQDIELRQAGNGEFFTLEEAQGRIPVHPNCYSKDTEVLTENGFKLIKDVGIGEKCISLNPDTFDLELVSVSNKVSGFQKNMVHFVSRDFDLLVTPDHNMFVKRRERSYTKKRFWEFVEAKDVKTESSFYRSSKWIGDDNPLVNINGIKIKTSLFASFMGWWLSEGCLVKPRNGHNGIIQISQSKSANPDKYKEILDICEKLKDNGKVWAAKEYIQFRNDRLYEYLRKFGKSYQKFVPDDIKKMSPRYIRCFLDCYRKGDGHKKKGKNFKDYKFADSLSYSTSSKKMADDLGELILKVGKRPSYSLNLIKGKMQKHKNGEYAANHDMWTINECNSKQARMGNVKKIDVQNYNDEVHCVELEKNHTLYVRRNGKVAWSGNCRCTWIPVVQND